MTKKAETVKADEKNENAEAPQKLKSMGVRALLTSENTGDKLAGVLRVFGECELLRGDLKNSTVVNKASKSGRNLRVKGNEELDKNESIIKAKKIISANFAGIKDCAKDKDAKFTDDMQEAYDILLSFGKKEKFDDLPENIEF